jgi:predicted nucleic acid-binding protein
VAGPREQWRIILEALDFEVRYHIPFWDALILHSAHASGVEVLYLEDLSDGQTYGSVRVVNPVRANT